ncbi:MAG: PEP-CTERM sorting domain-containing protein [Planctomycetota bacterium]
MATPIFDSFGPFPSANFGGDGIPNDSVAASKQVIDGDTTITIALSATQRFSNPPLTDDGAGTYFATPGSNFGGEPEGVLTDTEGALWNFNFFIDVDGPGAEIKNYQVVLLYDFDTGVDTDFSSLGVIDVTAGILAAEALAVLNGDPVVPTTRVEGSENLLFGFLATSVPGLVTPPAGLSFDPGVAGEYTFAIGVSKPGPPGFGFPIESVAIDVVVVPEPATASLAGFAMMGLLGARRRR